MAVLKKRNAAEPELSDGGQVPCLPITFDAQVLPLYPALKSIIDHMDYSDAGITEYVRFHLLWVVGRPYGVLGSGQHLAGIEIVT